MPGFYMKSGIFLLIFFIDNKIAVFCLVVSYQVLLRLCLETMFFLANPVSLKPWINLK